MTNEFPQYFTNIPIQMANSKESNPSEYYFHQVFNSNDDTSDVKIEIKTNSEVEPKFVLKSALIDVALALKENAQSPMMASITTPKLFTKSSILTLGPDTLATLLKYDKFDVKILFKQPHREAYSIFEILKDLAKPENHHIISYVFRNLVFDDEGSDLEVILKNITRFFEPDDYLLQVLAENNPFVLTFIRNGLSANLIGRIHKDNSWRVLGKFIDLGLMNDKINYEGALIIIGYLPYDLVYKLFSNISQALNKSENLADSDFIVYGIMTMILGLESQSNIKIEMIKEVFKVFPERVLNSIIIHVIHFVSGLSIADLRLFIKDFVKAITERTDIADFDKTKLFINFIIIYSNEICLILFSELRGFYLGLDAPSMKHNILSLIVFIIELRLPLETKGLFFQEVARFYPQHIVGRLFIWIEEMIGKENEPNSAPNVMAKLASILCSRTDIEPHFKMITLCGILQPYSKEIIIEIIKSIREFIEGVEYGSDYFSALIIIISQRTNMTLEDKKSIYSTIRTNYSHGFLSVIRKRISKEDEDIVL